mmetsp:Transcript_7412/g.22563  ORF Transcript_7412/g.22563 Transcript_7412/m.22563 type:complete len:410 (-) Transcript_7412:68-1297(-)
MHTFDDLAMPQFSTAWDIDFDVRTLNDDVKTDYLKVASLRHGIVQSKSGTLLYQEQFLCFPRQRKFHLRLSGNTVNVYRGEKPSANALIAAIAAIDCEIQTAPHTDNLVLRANWRSFQILCKSISEREQWIHTFERARNNDIRDHYTMGEIIGSGNFGKVLLGRSLETGEQVAIKIVKKPKHSSRAMVLCERELETLRETNHSNIVKTHDIFETQDTLFVVMELMTGGDLNSVYERALSEETAKRYMKHILRGVAYMHGKNLVHRDIKPQNVLLTSEFEPVAKLADFGLSTFLKRDGEEPAEALYSRVGTALFMAPEILRGEPYNEKVDMWACGVLLHFMLYGSPPFYGTCKDNLVSNVQNGIRTPVNPQRIVSPLAQDLVEKLINMAPQERYSAKEARMHSWFADEFL